MLVPIARLGDKLNGILYALFPIKAKVSQVAEDYLSSQCK